jgi:hypothetical protein
MSKKASFLIEFKVDQKEWDSFWSWIYTNTNLHHLGPEVSIITIDPMIKSIRELSMLFFLTHKQLICLNPPKCICLNRYIHIEDHLKDCSIRLFNAQTFKY